MSYTLKLYETADDDIIEAYSWYEQQKAGLGDEFLLSLADCCRKIIHFPFACQLKHKYYRQAQLSVFPYLVVYEVMRSEIVVYSVFHTSRNPAKKFKKKRKGV